MPRYVVLEHDHPMLHWDWMLEAGSTLRTWRLERPPGPDQVIGAVALAEHRLAYLDYEGAVSGGRGSVSRWDAGTFTWLQDTPDRLCLRLSGGKLQGDVEMRRTGPSDWEWQLCNRAVSE